MYRYTPFATLSILILYVIGVSFPQETQAQTDPPFTVAPNLFNQSELDSLGVLSAPGIATYTVFSPTEDTDHFSNGAVLIAFKDWLYCQWQSSQTDEDAADTKVVYSRSQDGVNWTAPEVLAPSIADGYSSSGGWWATEDTLVAYINTWPAATSPRGGFTGYLTSTDGENWSNIGALSMIDQDTLMGIFEQDPQALASGRIVSAAHFQPGLTIAPVYTDDPTGIRGWVRAEMTNINSGGEVSREIEPSWYLRGDDALIMIFRDQNSSYKKLASLSEDNGETWTTPVITDMPDARTKQSAGNLPDGKVYFVGNPKDDKLRIPLVITLSEDGFHFNQAYVMRKGGADIQDLRYEGRAKRPGYHYPKTYIWDDYLYVSYTTNKEDVEVTRVPLESLIITPTSVDKVLDISQVVKVQVNANNTVSITLEGLASEGAVQIFNTSGQHLLSGQFVNGAQTFDLSTYPAGHYVARVQSGGNVGVKMFVLTSSDKY